MPQVDPIPIEPALVVMYLLRDEKIAAPTLAARRPDCAWLRENGPSLWWSCR